jgi:two-component system response regulator HydG
VSIKILIVEDQFIEAKSLNVILTNAGYSVCSIARSVSTARSIIDKEKPDLVLVDILLQGEGTGIDLGKFLHEKNLPFVYLSANSDRKILNEAKKTRPYGFMVKPFRSKDVLIMLDVAFYLHQRRFEDITEPTQQPISTSEIPVELKNLIGRSPNFLGILDQANRISRSDVSVLILGESGTGKEVVAQAIHKTSSRRNKPFIAVNCGALPVNLIESELFGHEKGSFTSAIAKRIGKFELAEGGTIFLDEIGELPMELQVKFLRVLQEKEVEPVGGRPKKIDVRVLAATNKDLEEEVAEGRFRIDLYYRLNVFPMLLPPLRERISDIPLLVDHFLKKYSSLEGKTIEILPKKEMQKLMDYPWPGNIRELENTIQRNVILAKGPIIESLDIVTSKKIAGSASNSKKIKTLIELERDHILSALESTNWKVSGKGGAAELLDINVNTLNSKMKKLGIERK